MNNEQIDKIKEIVSNRYQAHRCGWTEFRSQGNSTDVFQDGFDCGESQTLYEIGILLGIELEEPAEQEYDF